jgi:hypothetical protein
MQARFIGWWAVGIAALAAAACDPGMVRGDETTAGGPSAAAAAPQAPAVLPLSRIVLFNSGVGFFQRDGAVNDDARVELNFEARDINDILKSLVLQDLDGGSVSTVTYTSRDPLTKTLKSFAIDLTEKPSLSQILDQVRGEQVEVASPTPVQGIILGIERQEQPAGKDGDEVVEVEILNLLTAEGLHAVPLNQIQRIKFLRAELDAELRQALAVLATGHDTEKKSVVLNFAGQGQRRVRVGYIQESPVWKTSYRLVLDDEGAPLLQGWAIVENTTDDDWNNVALTLVSGRPISFLMDLYQPLYVPRPRVQMELYSSLLPQRYGEAMEEAGEALAEEMEPADRALAERRRERERLGRGGGVGGGGLGGGGLGGAAFGRPAAAARPSAPALEPLAVGESVQSLAEAAEVGELFQYVIDIPVTLPRQRSAMLPIVNQSVEGEKVSIYNEAVQAKHPLNGLRLKNTTGLHLMQGPITVFDGNAYAGDAQITDMQPGADRLISYALDLDSEVEPVAKSFPQRLTKVRIAKGTLITTHDLREERTYNVKNRGTKDRKLLVEHPFRADWKLTTPKEPTERTRDVYRFAVSVAAGESAKLDVVEERQISQSIALSNINNETIAIYVRSDVTSPKVKDALARVVAMNNALSRVQANRARLEQRTAEITQEQSRIRQNMQRLAQNSELYGRYVKKLTEQEDELENLHEQTEKLRDDEARRKKERDDYLLSLDVE